MLTKHHYTRLSQFVVYKDYKHIEKMLLTGDSHLSILCRVLSV